MHDEMNAEARIGEDKQKHGYNRVDRGFVDSERTKGQCAHHEARNLGEIDIVLTRWEIVEDGRVGEGVQWNDEHGRIMQKESSHPRRQKVFMEDEKVTLDRRPSKK